MADEKKLVIKINYPNRTVNLPESDIPAVQYVTEWNIKRLAGAAAVLCLLALAGYFGLRDKGDAVKNNITVDDIPPAASQIKIESVPLPVQQVTADSTSNNSKVGVLPNNNQGNEISVKAESVTLANHDTATQPQTVQRLKGTVSTAPAVAAGKVVRAQLASSVSDKEPEGEIKLPLLLKNGGEKTLYYFTELQDMSGKLIYHEWLYKGKSVFKRPIKITDQHWRTATHKIIRSNALGDWAVQVVDENGLIMQKIDFKVADAN